MIFPIFLRLEKKILNQKVDWKTEKRQKSKTKGKEKTEKLRQKQVSRDNGVLYNVCHFVINT